MFNIPTSWLLVFAIGAIFWIFISLIHYRYNLRKYGIEVRKYGILTWRYKRAPPIDSIVNFYPPFWEKFGTISAIGGLMIGFGSTFIVLSDFFFETPLTIFFLTPLFQMSNAFIVLLILSSVIIIHELTHAIQMRAEGIEVESVGFFLFVLIPGIFTESAEHHSEVPFLKRLRIFGSGPMANFGFAFLCLSFTLLLVNTKIVTLVPILKKMYLTHVGVGLLNLLPIKPLDGGNIVRDTLQRCDKYISLSPDKVFSIISTFALGTVLLVTLQELFNLF